MITPKQIGWSQESNLLWEISKQLDRTLEFMCTGPCPSTTTTTTTISVCTNYLISFLVTPTPLVPALFGYIDCITNEPVETHYTSFTEPFNVCAISGTQWGSLGLVGIEVVSPCS